MNLKIFYLLSLLAIISACTPAPAPQKERATALYFLEQDETGTESRLRMIVGAKFLRIDNGEHAKDFILYERAARTIYNVNATDNLILVINPPATSITRPSKLQSRIKRDTAAYPPVGGKAVIHYRLLTNGRLCYDLYAAEGLLPEAVVVLREYRESLIGEQFRAIGFAPNEFKAPCDLANHVYEPARHLVHGFPVRLVEMDSRNSKNQRITELTDYRTDFEVSPQLFELPASYRRMTLRELQKR